MSTYTPYFKEYYQNNKEKILAKRPRNASGSTYTEYYQEYYQKNKALITEKKRQKYAENPEKYAEQMRIYNEKNKERLRE